MSDAIEKTAAGATKGFFGALGFILLMLGLEGMTGAAGIQFGVGLFLTLIGGLCFYAAFFWETAKKILSAEAQQAIGRFAQSRITWFGMIFFVLQTLILSRFIEEHHWPFSYPADPQIEADNNDLRNTLQRKQAEISIEKDAADKWRFIRELRQDGAGHLPCKFQILHTGISSVAFWFDLLDMAGWKGSINSGSPDSIPAGGITIRSSDDTSSLAYRCSGELRKALSDIYPNPPSKTVTNQFTSCGNECIEIDIRY